MSTAHRVCLQHTGYVYSTQGMSTAHRVCLQLGMSTAHGVCLQHTGYVYSWVCLQHTGYVYSTQGMSTAHRVCLQHTGVVIVFHQYLGENAPQVELGSPEDFSTIEVFYILYMFFFHNYHS